MKQEAYFLLAVWGAFKHLLFVNIFPTTFLIQRTLFNEYIVGKEISIELMRFKALTFSTYY